MKQMKWLSVLLAAIPSVLPSARAHDWHRHEDPQFANWPAAKPITVNTLPGETILLASASTGSSSKQVASFSSSQISSSFSSPANLGAAQLWAQTFVRFNPYVRFWWDSTNFHVESDGFPKTHKVMEGIWSWQRQIPIPQSYFGTNNWSLPMYPVWTNTPALITSNRFTQGAIALAANGIPIFNPYNNTGRISAQIGELDYWGGHTGRGDDYHYHAAPLHLTNYLGVALPLAFAMDGYPIYGLVEPDGSVLNTNTLDVVAGHTNNTGTYHYHASVNFPYVNGGFHGMFLEITNGSATQAGIQPQGKSPRPSGTPLAGAYIQTWTNTAVDQYQMFFSVPSNAPPTNYWIYTLNRAANQMSVTYSSYDSTYSVTTTNYNNWKPEPAYTSTSQPLVVTQPTNATIAAGATATFSASAAGLGTLSYQWLKNGVELSDGGNISGANTATLTVSNAQNADVGAYSLVVTNSVGNSLSTNATLAVTTARSVSQGRATTLVTNLYPAGQRVAGVGSVTASDGTVWTVPSATQFSTAPKAPDLYNETVGITPTNIAAVNLNAVPIVNIDSDGEVVTGYIFSDNYFELYVNGVLVGVDPVPYTPFNSCVVKFRAKRPISYAVKLVDWEENLGLGTELNGGDPNHAGDGGFIASFSDGTVTGPNWKAQSFYIAPLDNPSLVIEQPNGTHDSSTASTTTTLGTNAYALHYPMPTNWFSKNFDDSGWPTAATFTEAQVGVNNQWAYLNFRPQITNGGAQFIWSQNLVLDNEVIVRFTGPPPTNNAPIFAAATTNRYIFNGGDTLSVTNTATDSDTPAQTLTYSLLAAPVGATINTNSGVVTWATTTNNAGTSNYFSVVVTDNGTPAKSATNTFTAFVRSLKPNVVIIVTDDQGFGDVSSHGGLAPTPNMDRIGSEGIRLERFYPTPVCSVTRSTLMTGRNPIRTSVNNQRGLDLREHIMPVTFKAAGYQTFMCGKWHLGGLYNNTNSTVINGVTNTVVREGADYQPQNRGWDTHYGEYTGAIGYSNHVSQEFGTLDWWLNGQTNYDQGWSTDLLADKAIQLLQQRDPSKPAIVYLAFNAVHGPVSAPTEYLNKYPSLTGNRKATVAALDQMDVAMGRVLDAIDAEGIRTNTLVVYFSDNGGQAASGGSNLPLRGDKGDLYDGGIHTPAAVRWPGVLPSGVTNCQQFVWSGDWFPTICAATGVTPLNTKPFDGVNLWPLLLGATNGAFNPANYRGVPLVSGSSAGSGIFDVFTNTNGVATMFKLIRDKLPGAGAGFTNLLFDIISDPYETNDVASVPAYSSIVTSLSTFYDAIKAESYSPYIGVHPQSQSVTASSNLTLWAMATVYPKTVTTQWRKNGVNIIGATNRTTVDTNVYLPRLDLTNVTSADAASYDVVVTDNAVGWPTTVTSLVAVVTVTTPGNNTAPVLSPIANRTVNAGTTLLVSNIVTDAEVPPQTLAFTLPTAPSGASIDANTGLVTWTPTSGQANTTNAFTVVVTDNGTPPLSATQSFTVVVLPDSSPFLTISGLAISPATPTSNNTVWVTANISSSTNIAQAVLNYTIGSGGASTTNVVFFETMATNNTGTNGWDGTGAVYPWTVLSQTGAGSVKQTANANHTPAGTGNTNGLEFGKGSATPSQVTMATTANPINATGTSGYVEFWIATQNITNSLGWSFLVSSDNGTTFTARLSETNATAGHAFQLYHYDLLPSECVNTLKLRFQFFGNGVGGGTGPKVQIDDVKVAVVSAGAAYTAVTMADDGVHGDGTAGDGVYGGQIPAFATGTTVSYYLTATNNGGLTATNPAGAPTTLLSYTVTAPVITSTVAYDVLLGRPTDTSIAVSLLSSNDLSAYYEFGTSPGTYTGVTVTNSVTNNVPSVTTISGLQANQKYYYRLRYATNGAPSFSTGTERTFVTKRARGSTFTFLIEADPHNRDNVPDVWKLALTNMLADNADFLMDLGDTFFEEKVGATNAYFMTQPGIYDLHREVRNGFFAIAGHSLPLFLVNGNHDPELGWLATSTNSPAVWGVQAREYFYPVPQPGGFYSGATNTDPYTLAPRDAYYAFEWGDALFVSLDPYWYSVPKPSADGWSWTLGTNQYNWLKRTLETSTAKFKFVFAHHLIGGGGGGEARGGLSYHNNFEWGGYSTNGSYDFPTKRPGWPMPIKDLLLTNNVQVFFHGHDHLFVKEDFYAPGNTSSVPTFIYQEVPQPSQTIFSTNAAPGYAYTNAGSVVIASSGHLRVTVSPTNALVEYLRVFRPVDEGTGKTNRMLSYSYNIPIPVVSNGWSMLKLPDTGQTNDYTTVFGEDSDYTINPQSFTDNGDGTVTDNVTGLMWQKADGGEMTIASALTYAQSTLNATNFAGHSDWRLPNIHELYSLANHSKVNPALNTTYFTSPGATNFGIVYWWSQDQELGNAAHQWCANAGGGVGPKPTNETFSAGGTFSYRVRCVRGAPLPTAPRSHYVNNGDGTVTDTNTGLTWQQTEVGAAMGWTNALNYCETLSLGGFTDWRLPNIKELESLNDETRSSPSIDTNFFPNAKSARYWSSTTQFGHATNAWWNEFITGITSYEGTKTTNYWVRAVRGGLPNQAPVLSAIGNRTIIAGTTLSITNTVTDADQPAQTMTFSLLSAPTGAVLNSTSGVLLWRPAIAQAPSTNPFSVSVTDSGNPPLSGTQSFTVYVTQPAIPSASLPVFTNGALRLLINGDVGPDYTIETSTDLINWQPLSTTNPTAMPFFWIDRSASNFPMRFYRLLLGP